MWNVELMERQESSWQDVDGRAHKIHELKMTMFSPSSLRLGSGFLLRKNKSWPHWLAVPLNSV